LFRVGTHTIILLTSLVLTYHRSRCGVNEQVNRSIPYGMRHSMLTIYCDTRAQRSTVLHTIANDPETTVLLASLKCAAAGLNLQSCSVVCFLEPWWNPAIEVRRFSPTTRAWGAEILVRIKLLGALTVSDRRVMSMSTNSSLRIRSKFTSRSYSRCICRSAGRARLIPF
jgi:hypothetical protein